jgi:hypothetical protein
MVSRVREALFTHLLESKRLLQRPAKRPVTVYAAGPTPRVADKAIGKPTIEQRDASALEHVFHSSGRNSHS